MPSSAQGCSGENQLLGSLGREGKGKGEGVPVGSLCHPLIAALGTPGMPRPAVGAFPNLCVCAAPQ